MSNPSDSHIPEDPAQISRDVSHNGIQYSIIREGLAEILTPKQKNGAKLTKDGASKSKEDGPSGQSVFYNPIQQYNRDLSVLAIKAYAKDWDWLREGKRQKRVEQVARREKTGWGKKKKRRAIDTEPVIKSTETAEHGEEGGSIVVDERSEAISRGTKRKSDASDELEISEDVERHKKRKSGSGHVAPIVEGTDKSETVGHEGGVLGNESLDGEDSTTAALNKLTDQEVAGEEGQDHKRNTNVTSHTEEDTSQPPFRILDALSATGLRALRYAKEIPQATLITANDLSASATASIKLNMEHNKLSSKIQPTVGDAMQHMHHAGSRSLGGSTFYHVIDLDPYGTAAPFLDAAVQALVDGGLLCVTCTDAGVFASVGYCEKTYSQYGGLPLKGPHAHEGGLRLILNAIAVSAARYGLAMEPLLSLSIDFYARVFVRLRRSPADVKFLASKTMIVYSCDTGCGAWTTQHFARTKEKIAKNGDAFHTHTLGLGPPTNMRCEHCGSKMHLGGPMWGGPLHNPHFIQTILDMLPSLDKEVYGTIARMEGMLSIALNECLASDLALRNPTKPESTIQTQFQESSAKTSELTRDAPEEPTPQINGSQDPGSWPLESALQTNISNPTMAILPRPIPPLPSSLRSYHPFFFVPSNLAKILHCVSPSDAAMRGALLHLGYRTTRSHTKAGSICTDAPWSVVWEIMREWVRQKNPVKEGVVKKGMPGWGIVRKGRESQDLRDTKEELKKTLECDNMDDMRKELEALLYRTGKPAPTPTSSQAQGEGTSANNEGSVDVDEGAEIPPPQFQTSKLKIIFDEALGKESHAGKRMLRYQINPPDWGPMNRAKRDDPRRPDV